MKRNGRHKEGHDVGSYTDKDEGHPRGHLDQNPYFVNSIGPENKTLGSVVPSLARFLLHRV